MWLLLSYAGSDARARVRLFALRELLKLAVAAPHMWTADMTQVTTAHQTVPLPTTQSYFPTSSLLQALMECVSEAVSEGEEERGMVVMLKLSQSLAVQHMTSLQGGCGFSHYILVLALMMSLSPPTSPPSPHRSSCAVTLFYSR